MTYLLAALVLGLLPAAVAHSKGHPFITWWIFGTVLFLVALPIAVVMRPNEDAQRECPACLSWIPRRATACAKCTRDVPALAPAGSGRPRRPWDDR